MRRKLFNLFQFVRKMSPNETMVEGVINETAKIYIVIKNQAHNHKQIDPTDFFFFQFDNKEATDE